MAVQKLRWRLWQMDVSVWTVCQILILPWLQPTYTEHFSYTSKHRCYIFLLTVPHSLSSECEQFQQFIYSYFHCPRYNCDPVRSCQGCTLPSSECPPVQATTSLYGTFVKLGKECPFFQMDVVQESWFVDEAQDGLGHLVLKTNYMIIYDGTASTRCARHFQGTNI